MSADFMNSSFVTSSILFGMISTRRLCLIAALSFICLTTTTRALRCYVCDSTSEVGYFDAEKACNIDTSLRQCPDSKHKACMIEAFKHRDSGQVAYHIIKRCLVDCPVSINGSAEHTRCCVRDECNEVISIDVVADSRPHTKSASAVGFPGDRRVESPTEERSGSQSQSSDQTSRGSPGDKQQTAGGQLAGGPPPSYHGQPSDQPPRPSQVHGQQNQLGDSFGGRSSAAADSSHMLVQNYNGGFRGGQPAMMPITTTTHSSSPTLLAPGSSRHGDNAPSSRSKASGQLVSGASSRRATGTGATWVAISTTTTALMASFVRCTRQIL